MIGTTLSHYKITAKLGEGGMGEVYLAHDTKLKREVALKILAPDLASDPERLARFHREAEAVAALNHPSIVSIFSVEEDQGIHFITMEKVDGKSLDQHIPTTGFELSKFFDLALPLAEAIAAAHDRGITHRDLKPANVMVDSDGGIRVLDFGLAKVTALADADSTELPTLAATREGLALGTVPYMSPEQAQGLAVDHRADVFSLGVMLYEMAAGRRPFQGETSAALVSSILKDTPPTITELRSDLPNHLRRVIERCLDKNVDDRYQSARDLAIELKGLHRELEEDRLRSSTGTRPAVVASSDLAVGVLTIQAPAGDENLVELAEGLTEDITTGLAGFSYLSITESPSPESSADSLGARFLITGGLRRSGDALRLNVRIADAIKGQRLWSETYNRNLGETSVFEIQDDLTGCVVATIADAYGVLVRSMADLLQDKPADELSASEWVLRLYGYRQRVTPDEHAEMRDGLEKAVEREPRNADAWASLCQIYIDEDSFGFNLRPGALDRALDAARRAVDIDRTSQLGYQVLAQTHFFRRDLSAFRPAAERAMELNPLDSNTIGILGLMIVHTGEFDRGADLTRRAMKLNPHHAGWYHFGPLWQHFHKGNFEKALARVNQVNMSGQFWQHLATAAICAHLDRGEEARAAVQELLAIDPDFASHARQNIENWHFASGLLEPLLAGLRKAGLEIPEE